MEFMYQMVDERLTAGFAGLRSRLNIMYKPAVNIGPRIGTTAQPQYPNVQQQPQYNVRQQQPNVQPINPGMLSCLVPSVRVSMTLSRDATGSISMVSAF